MEIKDLAPWIAIAITLALSILVPLFTQIANNKHQRRLQKDNIEYEKTLKKSKVFEDFLLNVGGVITYANQGKLIEAGSALYNMYLFSPVEWYKDLDDLAILIQEYKWKEATVIMQRLSKLMAEELKKAK